MNRASLTTRSNEEQPLIRHNITVLLSFKLEIELRGGLMINRKNRTIKAAVGEALRVSKINSSHWNNIRVGKLEDM